MRKHVASRGLGDARTIQLLGSIDDMVSPNDNLDLVSGSDFLYFDVSYTGHANIIEMGQDNLNGSNRSKIFTQALLLPREELNRRAVEVSDQLVIKQRKEVKNVIFVVHGIRDEGYWTHKIARRVKKAALAKRALAAEIGTSKDALHNWTSGRAIGRKETVAVERITAEQYRTLAQFLGS